MKIDSTKGILEINRLIRKDMTQFECLRSGQIKKYICMCFYDSGHIYDILYTKRNIRPLLIIANSLYKML